MTKNINIFKKIGNKRKKLKYNPKMLSQISFIGFIKNFSMN